MDLEVGTQWPWIHWRRYTPFHCTARRRRTLVTANITHGTQSNFVRNENAFLIIFISFILLTFSSALFSWYVCIGINLTSHFTARTHTHWMRLRGVCRLKPMSAFILLKKRFRHNTSIFLRVPTQNIQIFVKLKSNTHAYTLVIGANHLNGLSRAHIWLSLLHAVVPTFTCFRKACSLQREKHRRT